MVLTLSSLTAIDARSATAQGYNPPWCVQYLGGRNGATNCSFHSYEQCMMTATPGSGGICVRNPWYSGYGYTTGRGERRRQYR
jgi:hypothetical protein